MKRSPLLLSRCVLGFLAGAHVWWMGTHFRVAHPGGAGLLFRLGMVADDV